MPTLSCQSSLWRSGTPLSDEMSAISIIRPTSTTGRLSDAEYDSPFLVVEKASII